LEFGLQPGSSSDKLKLELQRTAASLPDVTILKPLKGADEFTESCLRSWLTQEYSGEIQILFGVASEDDPLVSGGILESYRKISLGLHAGLMRLGITAQLADPADPVVAAAPGIKRGVCFDAAAGHELVVDGKKMIGSAQLRRKGAILQHGSILIDVDVSLHHQLVRPASALTREQFTQTFDRHVLTLAQVLGRSPSQEEIVTAMLQGFQSVWEVTFTPGGLNRVEQTLASELRKKYVSDAWNFSR
jgi:lipoate-protein ligase A